MYVYWCVCVCTGVCVLVCVCECLCVFELSFFFVFSLMIGIEHFFHMGVVLPAPLHWTIPFVQYYSSLVLLLCIVHERSAFNKIAILIWQSCHNRNYPLTNASTSFIVIANPMLLSPLSSDSPSLLAIPYSPSQCQFPPPVWPTPPLERISSSHS